MRPEAQTKNSKEKMFASSSQNDYYWNQEDMEKLILNIKKYGRDYDKISSYFSNRTREQIRSKINKFGQKMKQDKTVRDKELFAILY